MRAYFFQQLEMGQFAQWCPADGSGVPLLGNPQTGAFYPPNVLYLLLPYWRAMNVSIVVHLFLAGFGVFWLLRGMNLGRLPALAGAISYAFSGTMLSLTNTLDYFEASAWVPLFLHFVIQCSRGRPDRIRMAGGALSFAFILMNSVQYGAISAMLAALIACGCLWRKQNVNRVESFLAVLIMGLLGAALAAVQLLPTMHTIPASAYAYPISLAEATRLSLHPRGLLNLITPHFHYRFDGVTALARQGLFGLPRPTWLLDIYPGIFALFFAFVGLVRGARRERWWWAGLVLFSVLFAMSKHVPLYRWCYEYVPYFEHFRYSEKFFLFANLGLIVLAAFGLQSLFERPKSDRATFFSLVPLSFAFFVLLVWLTISPRSLAVQFMQGVFGVNLAQYGGPALAAFIGHLSDFITGWRITCLLALLYALTAWWLIKFPQRFRSVGVLILILCAVDLFVANRHVAPTCDASLYDRRPEASRVLETDAAPVRYARWLPQNEFGHLEVNDRQETSVESVFLRKEELSPSYGMTYGLASMHPISVLMPKQQEYFAARFGELSLTGRQPLYSLLDVKYVLSSSRLAKQKLEKAGELEQAKFFVYRVTDSAGRAFLVSDVLWANSSRQALDWLIEGKVDPKETVILESRQPENEEISPGAVLTGATCAVIDHKPNRVMVESVSNAPAFLVLAEAYAPGWRATVDGESVELLRAYGLLRSVAVPAGRHRVEFVYRQPGLIAGALVSLAGLFLFFGLLWSGWRKQSIEKAQS